MTDDEVKEDTFIVQPNAPDEDFQWMLRQCSDYSEEYKACKGLKSRLHHSFVHGGKPDCQYWKDLHKLCKADKEIKPETLAILRTEELKMRNRRIAKSRANDVWEYRTSPPADWDAPLPKELLDPEKNYGLLGYVRYNFAKKL